MRAQRLQHRAPVDKLGLQRARPRRIDVALAATGGPARRAARVEPAVALRSE